MIASADVISLFTGTAMLAATAALTSGTASVAAPSSSPATFPPAVSTSATTLAPAAASSASAIATPATPVSSADAVALHREAAKRLDLIVEATLANLSAHLKAGMPITEAQTADYVRGTFAREGLVTEEAPLVVFGPRTADPTAAGNGSRALARGDLVLLEIAAKRDAPGAIYADVTWIAFAGRTAEIPPAVVRAWSTVREARDRTVAALEDAMRAKQTPTGADLDHVARSFVGRARHAPRVTYPHATGHSLGTHDLGAAPNLSRGEARALVPFECVTVEPAMYYPGKFGLRSGVDVCLAPGSAEVSSSIVQREIRALGD